MWDLYNFENAMKQRNHFNRNCLVEKLCKISLLFALLWFIVSALGCAKIEPWERGYLALPYMGYDAYPLDRSFREHVYYSREALHAEDSAAGGGCGCN